MYAVATDPTAETRMPLGGAHSYEMPRPERDAVAAEFIATRLGGDVVGRFVGVEVTDEDGAIAEAARGLVGEVFGESFRDKPDTLSRMYEHTEADTRLLVVLDTRRRELFKFWKTHVSIAGVMQVVDGDGYRHLTLNEALPHLKGRAMANGETVKTIHDIERVHGIHADDCSQSPDKIRDIATLAIESKYRAINLMGRAAVAGLLQRMFINSAERDGITKVFALIDHKALSGLKAVGIPFNDVAGINVEFPVAGSTRSKAQIGHISEFRRLAARKYEELDQRTKKGTLKRLFSAHPIKNLLEIPRRRRIVGMAALGIDDTDQSLQKSLRYSECVQSELTAA